ncbi:MAG: hypothetical protein E6K02_03975 [Methanobacteriota archaeon]|nr:MAG: hypothetical protein E6K02_03975 [Euryarchaeota archaeon]
MKPTTRDHVVAATHFVLGPSNFVVIRLPEQWDLRLGRQPMDVDYTVAVDGVRWAQEGRASGLLVDLQARRAIELSVRTSRGPIPPPKLDESRPGTSKVGGHAAAYTLGSAHFGLFGTKLYHVLHVSYRCDETQRIVDLRFMHQGTEETLEGLLPALAGTRCH